MASKSDLARAKQKQRALMNARLSLKHAFERIDYRFDVIDPAMDKLEEQSVNAELPDITIEDPR